MLLLKRNGFVWFCGKSPWMRGKLGRQWGKCHHHYHGGPFGWIWWVRGMRRQVPSPL